jgi:hypothetical protein
VGIQIIGPAHCQLTSFDQSITLNLKREGGGRHLVDAPAA